MNASSHVCKLALLAGFAVAALSGMGRNANAAPITWTLEGVTFDDGGIATGSFTVDNGAVTSWDVSATAGSALGAFTYDTADSDAYGPLPDLHFITMDNLRYVRFHFENALSSPGTDPILTTPQFTSYECGNNPVCSEIREVTAGDARSVPEPASLAVLGSGLLGLGLVLRHRSRTRSSALPLPPTAPT